MGKNSSSQKLLIVEDKKISVFSACRFASSEKVFCTIIYGIEISLSPPIFEPVQLTLQTKIRVKYLSTLCFNPLTVAVGYVRHENLTYLWSWTPKRVPRSVATHVPLCNTVSTDKLSKNSEFCHS